MNDPDSPATPRQIAYAQSLGLTFDEKTITKSEISKLLDEAVSKLKPTGRMLEQAAALGIPVTDDMMLTDLKKLLYAEYSRLGREAIKHNPTLTAGTIIIHNGIAYQISFAGRRRNRYLVDLRPLFKGKGRFITVAAATVANATQADQQELMRAAERIPPAKSNTTTPRLDKSQ